MPSPCRFSSPKPQVRMPESYQSSWFFFPKASSGLSSPRPNALNPSLKHQKEKNAAVIDWHPAKKDRPPNFASGRRKKHRLADQ